VTVAGTGQSFEVEYGDRILAAARRAGVWFPFECGWGSCGTCKATLVEGETELLFAQAPCVDPRDARRRRVVVCQSTPTTDVVIRVSGADDAPRAERATLDYVARLVAREELGPDIARFVVELNHVAVYRPGQYAILQLGPGLRRCYSMAGPPGSSQVSFIAKRYADRPGSERLFSLASEALIDLELPYGDMWLRPSPRAAVLVAGGTGISAILAMTQELAQDAASRPVHVFFGAASRAELVCWDELGESTGQLADGHLHGALLEPGAGWEGTTGFVTTALADRLPGLGDADFYVAGPPPMTDAVRALLREHDVQLDHVWYDSFG
jgi:toluene monooxygenase electron transfer component